MDEYGLDRIDRDLLLTIIEKFDGGPVGVDTLAAAINEEVETIEDVCEPYLMQIGYLQRTPRGRVATSRAYQHLGLTPPVRVNQEQLFDAEGVECFVCCGKNVGHLGCVPNYRGYRPLALAADSMARPPAGDIVIKREGFTFYFPLATCILLSLVLSLLARIFNR